MISEKDYNEIYLKGYEDGKKDNNNLKITYTIKPSFTTRKLEKLQQENKKYKEVIDKANKLIDKCIFPAYDEQSNDFQESLYKIKEVLKEVE